MRTSCGELDIELWTKEAPRACRNFVQLCMEGYYDGTTFHRIIRNFMAQGGDPTGTGEGGESIYGHPFKDEFHSRLRFVRRGLVAMANSGPNDNGSQFFISLGPCEHLQNKHTIFGKVAGNTIYNAVKLGEVEVGADDRPMYPPKIKSTQILANPFEDIIPRQLNKKPEKEEKKARSKSKATKNFSLLSFGEEAEEDEEETSVASMSMKNKSKSMHDLVKDPKLSSVPAVDIAKEKESKRSSEERLHPSDQNEEESDSDDGDGEDEEAENVQRKKEMADRIRSKLVKEKEKKEEPDKDSSREEKPLSRKEELQAESRKLTEELREGRKRKQKDESSSQAKPDVDEVNHEEEPEPVGKTDDLQEFHAQKKKFKTMKKTMAKKGASREEQTLAMLAKFQNKLHSAILSKKPETEREKEEREEGEYVEEEEMKKEEEEEKEEGEAEEDDWLAHSLQFENHENTVKDANVKDADTFTIFDPRNPMNKRRREDGKQKKKERR